jgi:hypothetical protein
MGLKDTKKSPVTRQAFFHLLLWFFAATASLGAAPAYSVDLADPFPGKEARSPTSEGVTTHTLRALLARLTAATKDGVAPVCAGLTSRRWPLQPLRR